MICGGGAWRQLTTNEGEVMVARPKTVIVDDIEGNYHNNRIQQQRHITSTEDLQLAQESQREAQIAFNRSVKTPLMVDVPKISL